MANQVETIINFQLENRDRKTVFWRGILVAPIFIFVASFTASVDNPWITGLIFVPTVLALVVRGIYPSYLLSFNNAFLELETRVAAYLLLLTDDYQSIERNPNIAILLPDIDGGRKLNRILPLVKWLLSIHLVIVGLIYVVLALIATFLAWIITSLSGTYPKWALDIVLGTIKFWNRLYGYAILLVTDEYPSFSIS